MRPPTGVVHRGPDWNARAGPRVRRGQLGRARSCGGRRMGASHTWRHCTWWGPSCTSPSTGTRRRSRLSSASCVALRYAPLPPWRLSRSFGLPRLLGKPVACCTGTPAGGRPIPLPRGGVRTGEPIGDCRGGPLQRLVSCLRRLDGRHGHHRSDSALDPQWRGVGGRAPATVMALPRTGGCRSMPSPRAGSC